MRSLRVYGTDIVQDGHVVLAAGDGILIEQVRNKLTLSVVPEDPAAVAVPPSGDWLTLLNKPVSFPADPHVHPQADVANLVADLAGKADAAALALKADTSALALKADVPALNLKAPLASPALTGTPTAPTPAAGDNSTKLATTAYARQAAPNGTYRTILDCSGSHTAAKVAGVYGLAQGQPLAVTGVGILYPLNSILLAAADYPTVDGLPAKLRIRAELYTNDVAPTGNYTVGLHPITRPAVSGGAGLCIYTIGVAVAGSNGAVFTAPSADGLLQAVGADFNLPADGHYILAVTTTATVAVSAHLHLSAQLQMRNA